MGIQPGSQLSSAPSGSFSDPIGYSLIPASGVGTNYLPTITLAGVNLAPPFFGVNSLAEGSYAGWLNETGPASTYRLNFVATAVPEPSSLSMIALYGMFLLSKRRR